MVFGSGRVGGVALQRLDSDGSRLGEDALIAPSPADAATVAGTGPEFSVVWRSEVADGDPQIWVGRVTERGQLIGSTLVAQRPGVGRPRLARAQSGRTAIVWTDRRTGRRAAYLVLMDRDGELLGEELSLAADAGRPEAPAVVAAQGGFAAAWIDERTGVGRVRVAWIDQDGQRLAERPVSNNEQQWAYLPELTFARGCYTVAWLEGLTSLMVARGGREIAE